MIPWQALARILVRIGGAILLQKVMQALLGEGHPTPAPIDLSAEQVAELPDRDLYPEDEQDFALGCPQNDDHRFWNNRVGHEDFDDWEDL